MQAGKIQVFLASNSPRRAELLTQMGVSFRQLSVSVPEVPGENESCDEYVCRLARQKAHAGWASVSEENSIVIGSDTVILHNNQILEKPLNEKNAIEMLSSLSNDWHSVKTAVSIYSQQGCETLLQTSRVEMGKITLNEIKQYWLTGEPCDKAGAYAVQGKGAIFIKQIEGSYSGIMGLPIYETARLLNGFGIKCL